MTSLIDALVRHTPLGRPLSQDPPNSLGQVGDEGPADVLATIALAGVNVAGRGSGNLTDVTAAQAFD